jgi:hypothetical protein
MGSKGGRVVRRVQVAAQTRLSQNVNLQLRPWNTKEFVLWLNEIDVDILEGLAAVKVLVTALPRGGGMPTIEIRYNRSGSGVR